MLGSFSLGLVPKEGAKLNVAIKNTITTNDTKLGFIVPSYKFVSFEIHPID